MPSRKYKCTHLRDLGSAALSCGSAVLGGPPRGLLHREAFHCRGTLRAQPLRQLDRRLRGGRRAPRAGRAHHGGHQRVALPVRMHPNLKPLAEEKAICGSNPS